MTHASLPTASLLCRGANLLQSATLVPFTVYPGSERTTAHLYGLWSASCCAGALSPIPFRGSADKPRAIMVQWQFGLGFTAATTTANTAARHRCSADFTEKHSKPFYIISKAQRALSRADSQKPVSVIRQLCPTEKSAADTKHRGGQGQGMSCCD